MFKLRVAKFVFALMALPGLSVAQGNMTVLVKKPVYAKHLDGYVGVASAYEALARPVAGVRVDECDTSDCRHVLDSTISDKAGHFHLTSVRARSTYYLRLTAKNFNLMFYTVKLSPHAPSKLFLKISPGT